jgi:hypothetical protein
MDATTAVVQDAAVKGGQAIDDMIHGKNAPLLSRMLSKGIAVSIDPFMRWLWGIFAPQKVKVVNP